MLKNIMYARFKIFLIVIVTVILISCSEKKEQKSEVKPGSNKSPDKISSAGIKEGETEFRVEYDLPRRIYLIEKEDLNNDGNREIIVLSVLKDTSRKYIDNTKFDKIEVFALNAEKKSYEKILSDTVDFSDTCLFADLGNNKSRQIIIHTNTLGNDPVTSEGMFIYDMKSPEKIELLKYFDSGAPHIDSLQNDGRKQIVVSDTYWGVMPGNEMLIYESGIYQYENNKLEKRNSLFGNFFDKKIKEALDNYTGIKKKIEMGMQPGNMSFPLYREAAGVVLYHYSKEDLKGLEKFWKEEKDYLKKSIPQDEFTDLSNFISKILPVSSNV